MFSAGTRNGVKIRETRDKLCCFSLFSIVHSDKIDSHMFSNLKSGDDVLITFFFFTGCKTFT